mgnify:FL=1
MEFPSSQTWIIPLFINHFNLTSDNGVLKSFMCVRKTWLNTRIDNYWRLKIFEIEGLLHACNNKCIEDHDSSGKVFYISGCDTTCTSCFLKVHSRQGVLPYFYSRDNRTMPADPFYVEQRLLLMATITIVRASRSLPGLTQLTFSGQSILFVMRYW